MHQISHFLFTIYIYIYIQCWKNVFGHLVERYFIDSETHPSCVRNLVEYFKIHIVYVYLLWDVPPDYGTKYCYCLTWNVNIYGWWKNVISKSNQLYLKRVTHNSYNTDKLLFRSWDPKVEGYLNNIYPEVEGYLNNIYPEVEVYNRLTVYHDWWGSRMYCLSIRVAVRCKTGRWESMNLDRRESIWNINQSWTNMNMNQSWYKTYLIL